MADNGSSNWTSGSADNLNLPDSESTTSPLSAGDGGFTFLQLLQKFVGESRALDAFLFGTGLVHDLALGGHKITGLATPSSTTDAATKAYVDATAQGLSVKQSVKGASTTNHSVSAFSGSTIDGGSVSLSNGDRILLKDQSTASQNGIWVFNGAGSALTRPTDFATGAQEAGAFVFVESGTTNGASGWVLASTAVTVDTTAQTWTQFSGAGEITAGAGLTKSGNTINVVANADASITVNADDIQVAALGITTGKIAANAVSSAKVDSSVEVVSHKDAASGYMGLDASGRGNSSPKTHARIGSDHTDPYQATVTKRITVPRDYGCINSGIAYLTSGVPYVERIRLPGGETYSSIVWWSGSSGGLTRGSNSDSHLWFFLTDSSGVLVAITADDTSGAWAVNSAKSLSIANIVSGASATYTTPAGVDADYYLGLMVNIGTGGSPALPGLWGTQVISTEMGLAPVLNGNTTDVSQTTPFAFPKTVSGFAGKGIRCKAELR